MRDLELRKIRRQCFVPGCRNTDCVIASRSREMSAQVILCRDCIADIYRGMFPQEETPKEQNEEQREEQKEEQPEQVPTRKPRTRKADGE